MFCRGSVLDGWFCLACNALPQNNLPGSVSLKARNKQQDEKMFTRSIFAILKTLLFNTQSCTEKHRKNFGFFLPL